MSTTYETDSQLIQAIIKLKEGDESGFVYLYEATYKYVSARAKAMLDDEQERQDFIQEIYLAIYRSIKNLEEPEKIYGWIKSLIFNQYTKLLKKRRKEVLVSEEGEELLEEIPDYESQTEDDYVNKEDIEIIRSCIERLPEEQRTVVMAYYFDNLKVGEISDLFSVSDGTVKSRLFVARKKLKENIEEEEKKLGYKLHSFGGFTLILAIRTYLQQNMEAAHMEKDSLFTKICNELGLTAQSTETVAGIATENMISEAVKESTVNVANAMIKVAEIGGKKLLWTIVGVVSTAVVGISVIAMVLSDKPEEPESVIETEIETTETESTEPENIETESTELETMETEGTESEITEQETTEAESMEQENTENNSSEENAESSRIPSEGLEYTLNDDGTYTLIGIGTCTDSVVIIPEVYNGIAITAIGKGAFFMANLTEVYIPNSITQIGAVAFAYCQSLTDVTIANGVKTIGESAFSGCLGLVSITIPASVTTLETDVFYFTPKLKYITVEKGNSVYHSSGNCIIDTESKTLLFGCNNSTIPEDGSVEKIGDSAFAGCENLFRIRIPGSVTSIGNSAFYACDNLTEVIIEHGVTDIGDWAFAYCDSLTGIVIPASVTSMGETPVLESAKVTSITVTEGNPVYHSAGNCVIETESKTLIFGCNNSTIPTDGSVTSIGEKAFDGCRELTHITIPDSVTYIAPYAFHGCKAITDIVIPNSVTHIDDYAFNNCDALTSIQIPDSVTHLGDCVFSFCDILTDVVLSNSVTYMGWNIFDSSYNLTDVDYTGTIEEWKLVECKYGLWDYREYIVHCSDGDWVYDDN